MHWGNGLHGLCLGSVWFHFSFACMDAWHGHVLAVCMAILLVLGAFVARTNGLVPVLCEGCRAWNSASGAQVTPLLAELRSGHVVANLEALTASAADAARDLHKLQNEARLPHAQCNPVQ